MKLRLFAAPFATLLTIASLGMLVHGEVPDVPTGQWLAGPALVQPRAGAVSVALDDGRVLVIGGRTADGPVNTVDVFGTDGVAQRRCANAQRRAWATRWQAARRPRPT